jgi:hypothetical protein
MSLISDELDCPVELAKQKLAPQMLYKIVIPNQQMKIDLKSQNGSFTV